MTTKIDKSKQDLIDKNRDYNILELIDELEGKELKVYSSILKGYQTQSMVKHGYPELKHYGRLRNYQKSEINEFIEDLYRRGYLKYFGCTRDWIDEYDVFCLSGKGQEYLKSLKSLIDKEPNNKENDDSLNIESDIESLYINSIQALTSSLITSSNRNVKLKVIDSAMQNISRDSNGKKDIGLLSEFLRKEVKAYEECDKELINLVAKITPIRFKNMYKVESSVSSGKAKEVLLSIFNKIEESQ
jgi:superfamily II DNA helicase RecQ